MPKSTKILQVFNRYIQYGGEEGSVEQIDKTLGESYDLNTFYFSTRSQLDRPYGKLRIAGWMLKNRRVLEDLREHHQRGMYDFWQIHNVFPAASVAVYELATELGVPVIQYLHNYRFGCLNATYFRDGHICRDCSPTHYAPGIRHGCWRNSRMSSIAMALALSRFWKSGSMNSIRGFIAISEDQKAEHVAMGIPAEKIHVVPHFLNVGEVSAEPANPSGDVLYLGRITEEKGVRLLLDAWSRVDARDRTLRIVGDGPQLPEMKRHAEKIELKNVVFEGFVPQSEQESLWRNSALIVVPSAWMEPFGMVVLEAWRRARPVLATSHGSFPEMIRDGIDGWLASTQTAAFAEGLERALTSGSISEMGDAGRERLIEHFNSEIWLSRINQAYKLSGVI